VAVRVSQVLLTVDDQKFLEKRESPISLDIVAYMIKYAVKAMEVSELEESSLLCRNTQRRSSEMVNLARRSFKL